MRKRPMILLLLFSLVLSLSAAAATEPLSVPVIRPKPVQAEQTQTVSMSVIFPDDLQAAGFTFCVDYDKTQLQFIGAEPGFRLEQSSGEVVCNPDTGLVTWAAETNDACNGEVLRLVFLVREDATPGKTPVRLSVKDSQPTNLVNADGDALAAAFQDSWVEVIPHAWRVAWTAVPDESGQNLSMTFQITNYSPTEVKSPLLLLAFYDRHHQMINCISLDTPSGQSCSVIHTTQPVSSEIRYFLVDSTSYNPLCPSEPLAY